MCFWTIKLCDYKIITIIIPVKCTKDLMGAIKRTQRRANNAVWWTFHIPLNHENRRAENWLKLHNSRWCFSPFSVVPFSFSIKKPTRIFFTCKKKELLIFCHPYGTIERSALHSIQLFFIKNEKRKRKKALWCVWYLWRRKWNLNNGLPCILIV